MASVPAVLTLRKAASFSSPQIIHQDRQVELERKADRLKLSPSQIGRKASIKAQSPQPLEALGRRGHPSSHRQWGPGMIQFPGDRERDQHRPVLLRKQPIQSIWMR
jgi:hypothetical protein